MSPSRQRELNIFRYVPSSSPVHRMWAGTKLACLTLLGLALLAKPTWPAIATVAVVAAAYARASRLPRSVVGRPPNWFFIGVGIACVLSTLSFGKPDVHLSGVTIGLGGLIYFLRFTTLGLVLVSMGLMLGWTTQLADIASAVDRLAAPLRLVRVPTDEIVLSIGLSVRCLPLLAEDIKTLRAAWRVRAPVRQLSWRERVQELRDLLVAALVSSLRRAREMADAIDARGGPQRVVREGVSLGLSDLTAVLVVVTAVALIALV
jgi:energy-coupling factor transporter transmembrane protein EcfT